MPYIGNGFDLQCTITRSVMLQSTHKMFRPFFLHLHLHHFAAPCKWRQDRLVCACLHRCLLDLKQDKLAHQCVLGFFFSLDYNFMYLVYVKYVFKEVERKESDIMWPRSQRKSREQPSLTWCWFDEHNVVPLSLPNPSSVCWPKRALFKTHKSNPPVRRANNSLK